MKISTLKKVHLREIWKNEARNFTTWLALPENLALLSEEIGIDITHKETEASVGRYSLDILAEESETERTIIIENQLESTDHDHLGKVITYASGLDAEIMIWVVKDARDEHRQAVQWLNEHTNDHLNFFLIQIEAWQVGDHQEIGPKFNVICKPNNWAKALKERKTGQTMTDLKLTKLDFWNGFMDFAEDKETKLRLSRTVGARHWYVLPIGVSSSHMAMIVQFNRNIVWYELFIKDDKELFYQLESQKDEIEKQLGFPLVWEDCKGKACRIKIEKTVDLSNTEAWKDAYQWYLEMGEKFTKVFPKYL